MDPLWKDPSQDGVGYDPIGLDLILGGGVWSFDWAFIGWTHGERENLLMLRCFAVLALLAGCQGAGGVQSDLPVRIFVLTGQSNMVGWGNVEADKERNGGQGSLEHLAKTEEGFAHLAHPDGGWKEREDVWIAFGERQGPLTVGYGARPNKIGPELGFGHVVGEALDGPVLIVKVAWGGKSLAEDFRPPSAGGEVGECYRDLFNRVRAVLEDRSERFPELEGRGMEIAGIGWHQGWNDRINQEFNGAYEHNLTCFIRDARKELGLPNLPFVIAETGMGGVDEKHPRALSLMQAQAAVAQREEFRGNVAFVQTRGFFRPAEESPSDQVYHWNNNAGTYYWIGAGMGEAMLDLLVE